jgi:hypothetical protein
MTRLTDSFVLFMGGCTLAGLFLWALMFAMALSGLIVFFLVFAALGVIVVPYWFTYTFTKASPRQSIWYCIAFCAAPLCLTAFLVLSADTVMAKLAVVAVFGVTSGLCLIGWHMGMKSNRRSPAVRLSMGLCPACAYPIGTSPVCTECGKPVRVRTGMGLPPPATPAQESERTG